MQVRAHTLSNLKLFPHFQSLKHGVSLADVVELVPVYVMLPGGTELSVTPVAEVKVRAPLALPPRASDRTLPAPVATDPLVHLVGS